jgi:hypothetical protein
MKKTTWHTDIVVGGQGIGVKIEPSYRGSCAVLTLKPDVPGKKADRAVRKFRKAVDKNAVGSLCSTRNTKNAVTRAVRKTKARWNRWHREAYGR